MMVIGGLVVFMLAVIGLAINMTGFLDSVYMDLALTLPKFDYSVQDGVESGNETFEAFVQMRYVAGGIMGVAIIWAGVARALEGTGLGMVSPGTSNRIISRSLLFLLLFLAFPPLWDGGAEVMEGAALWVLNPHYTFDPQNPCPREWSDADIADAYAASPYRRGPADADMSVARTVCEPQFKIRYVFGQMMGATELQDTKGAYLTPEDPFGALTADVQNFAESVLVNTFLGLTKALVTINVLLMAFIIGIMADLLVGMIIAALPVFLMLTLIPRAESVANRFLDSLPALLLLPLLSAVVISVGAGFVAQIDSCVQECGSGDLAAATIYAWVSSLGVVFFAVSLPVLMVPLLGQVTQVASRTVTGAIQTAGTVAGTGAAGAIQGIRSGLHQPGGMEGLSGLARTAGAGTLGGLLGGISGAKTAGTGGFGGMEPLAPVSRALASVRSHLAGGTPAMVDSITRESAHRDVKAGLAKIGGEADALAALRAAGVKGLPGYDGAGDIRELHLDMEKARKGSATRAQLDAWGIYDANPSWERRLADASDDASMTKLAQEIKAASKSRHDTDTIKKVLGSDPYRTG